MWLLRDVLISQLAVCLTAIVQYKELSGLVGPFGSLNQIPILVSPSPRDRGAGRLKTAVHSAVARIRICSMETLNPSLTEPSEEK